MNRINIFNKVDAFNIDDDAIADILKSASAALRRPQAILSVQFVDPDEIASLNSQHRGKDRPTDVLSFPQLSWTIPAGHDNPGQTSDPALPQDLLGDIVVCPEVAQQNAKGQGMQLSEEIIFLLIHSVLHLVGHTHDDPESEKKMFDEHGLILNSVKDVVGLRNIIWPANGRD